MYYIHKLHRYPNYKNFIVERSLYLTVLKNSNLGLLRYQVDFAAQECDFSDDDFDLMIIGTGLAFFSSKFQKKFFWV